MELSKYERLVLANQYKILSLLDSSNAADHDRICEALEQGFPLVYEELFKQEIFDGLTRAAMPDSRLVSGSEHVFSVLLLRPSQPA